MRARRATLTTLLLSCAVALAIAHGAVAADATSAAKTGDAPASAAATAAVAAPDRSADDRALDEGRDPGAMLAFSASRRA